MLRSPSWPISRDNRAQAITGGVLLLGLLFTASRALGWPNDYAESHWVIDYRFGFVKRGLVGAALEPFIRHTPTEQVEWAIRGVASSILGAYLVALLGVLLRILRASAFDARSVLIVALFVTSNQAVMAGHLNGYYDQILYLITFAAVVLCAKRWYAAAGALQALAVLVHENYVMIGLPVVVFALLHPAARAARPAQLCALLPPLCAIVAVGLNEILWTDPVQLRTSLSLQLLRFPFIHPFQALGVAKSSTMSLSQHLMFQSQDFVPRLLHPRLAGPALPFIAIASLLTFLPYLTAARWRRLVLPAGAIVCPILLLAVAIDRTRIWSFAQMSCLLVIWVQLRALRIAEPPLGTRALRLLGCAALATLALQVLLDCKLLARQQEHFAPWLRALLCLPIAWLILRETFRGPSSSAAGLTSEEQAAALATAAPLSPSSHG